MKKFICSATLLLSTVGFSQSNLPPAEQKELSSALAEAGNSPLEFARVLEQHLAKYPTSPQREELERTLVKAAIEAGDKRRTLVWGEKSLAKNIDQPQVLERVTRILLESDDKESSERALKYAKQYGESLRSILKDEPKNPRQKAEFIEQYDKAVGRSLSLQARAYGNLGKTEEAVALALRSFETYPSHESAREAAKWLAKAGKGTEAARHYADAFVAPDNPAELRAKDRALMAEQYRKEKGNEEGLGDLLLKAHDRAVAIGAKRLARLREFDPNTGVSNPTDYTLSALQGGSLKLSSLRGKVVVMDFWATWCGPCRVQHPLYEEVKKKFAGRDDVVFLNISTDEDTSVVRPFLESNQWNTSTVYFEDGLGALLRVSSIPTTVIYDKTGQVFSRMNGFVPEKFVDQLTARISEALAE
jgi:thiol-disulfide isomerase/thioredoxin